MNIKTLITTLILGSSSIAMAKPATISGYTSASVSLGYNTQPSGPVVRDHRHRHDSTPPLRPIHSEPVYTEPVYTRPVYDEPVYTRPIYNEPFYTPTNTRLSGDSSSYTGRIGRTSPMAQRWNHVASFRRQTWVNLTEPTRIDNGRQFFTIGAESGRFSKIMLQNVSGWSELLQVKIELNLANGQKQWQTVSLDRSLDRNNPMIAINLDGGLRSINRIVVYGSTGNGAAYQILAM